MGIWQSAIPNDNVAKCIDNLASNCPRSQILREFTTNALEAKAEHIFWGVDHLPISVIDEDTGEEISLEYVPKASLTDDGEGMLPDTMIDNLKDLHKTTKEFGQTKNLGVGAKISAAAICRKGVHYLSWRDGKGYLITFLYDEEEGNYGIEKKNKQGSGSDRMNFVLELPDNPICGKHPEGTCDCVAFLRKPEIIARKGSGTKVIFMGNAEDEITSTMTFFGLPAGSSWCEYLQHRYYDIPDNVYIRAYDTNNKTGEIYEHTSNKGADRGTLHRIIRGLKYSLNTYSTEDQRGSVRLAKGAVTAHWWVYKTSDKGSNRYIKRRGHIGLIFRDELYNLTSAKSLYSDFGLVFGIDKIWILLEVHIGRMNGSRTDILLGDNEPIKLEPLAKEFSKQLPPQLLLLQETGGKQISINDQEQAHQELQQLLHLFDVIYKVDPKGTMKIEPTSASSTKEEKEKEEPNDEPSPERSGGSGGPRGKPKSETDPRPPRQRKKREMSFDVNKILGTSNSGSQTASPFTDGIKLPNARWATPDEYPFDGMAAHFDQNQNTVFINSAFPEYHKLLKYCTDETPDNKRSIATSKVELAYQLQLCEYIAVTYSLLISSPTTFSKNSFDTAVSDEALTVAASLRLGILTKIRNEIRKV